MRTLVTWLGAGVILIYSVLGAMLIASWEPTAASGFPLNETLAAMEAAGQPYSVIPGVIFAVVGGILAIAWAVATLAPAFPLSGWFAFAAWGGILAFGAPAYFFASFGNMNSIGDTFY